MEFIEQILDAQNAFLHLDSRDASIFVYKKTIYEINPDLRTEVENTPEIDDQFKEINAYIQIYKQVPFESIEGLHKMLSEKVLDMETLLSIYDLVTTPEIDIMEQIAEIIK